MVSTFSKKHSFYSWYGYNNTRHIFCCISIEQDGILSIFVNVLSSSTLFYYKGAPCVSVTFITAKAK